MQSDLSELKDALFFFLLLIDVVKACALAHWSLSCPVHNADEVAACISQGMAVLGPAITLDTVVETLVIGIGTLSGVRKLEVLCGYGCLSAVVNYVVFMTFYPACLALVLELSAKSDPVPVIAMDLMTPNQMAAKSPSTPPPQWQQQVKLLKQMMALEQTNPVVQRVKMMMAAGLMVVHAHCRFVFTHDDRIGEEGYDSDAIESAGVVEAVSEESVLRWLSMRADQLVLLILVLALTVKFAFFDDRHDQQVNMSLHSARSVEFSRLPSSNAAMSFRARALSIAEADDADLSDSEALVQSVASVCDKEIQTELLESSSPDAEAPTVIPEEAPCLQRSREESLELLKSYPSLLSDLQIIDLVDAKHIAARQLEKVLDDPERGVRIRRSIMSRFQHPHLPDALPQLPFADFDYSKVFGVCCENVLGYVPVPMGYAGPLLVDGNTYYIPLATTEGCLVASTNRGCSALVSGVNTELWADGMTRAPVVRLPNVRRAAKLIAWLSDETNLNLMKSSFNATSRFARLQKIQPKLAGRQVFLRFVATTGDAMGMNMVSKGTEASLQVLQSHFSDLEVISLSGNLCMDKKPSAINWVEGRGKSVVSEAVVPASVVEKVLKTSVSAMVDLNKTKNLIGSSLAGSIGGNNAHAANIVAAMFIATGQDPAQVVTSSNCITLMEPWGDDKRDLYISCTMPSLEIGTVGGGTGLPAQSACLQMLGVKGANVVPGDNASRLARIVCATVLAGELSLMASLAAGHLVKSHMTHNRSTTLAATTTRNDLSPTSAPP